MKPIMVEDNKIFIIIIIIIIVCRVYDFRTGTIRPLDAISRTFFLRDPFLKRVKTMKSSTCLEDLITVAILSVPSTWDIGLLCMNNLVVGT